MEQVIIGFLILLVVGLVGAIFLLAKRKPEKQPEALIMLQQQLNHISQVLDNKLSESTRAIQTQFGQSTKLIQNVTEKLTRLDETNKQVVSFADQLQNLQDILKNPKQRGILGEYYLETVLKNVLPPGTYQMQYSFKDGTIVDAVVFIDKRIVPIDSKFSLENYNRIIEAADLEEKKRYESAFITDLKNRIEETAKYVKPEENTMDFAFMFIPSEAVYYDLLINKVGAVTDETNSLIYYAGKKKVIVVSPTSFLAYLQTVLQGLRNQKISEQAKEIIKEVERLSRHLWTYGEYMKKLGNHLGTTVSAYNKASKEFTKVDKDVVKIAGGKQKINIKEVEPPLIEN
ncbi:MAG: DNA recombination protein RmuC [Candidatus Nealsonbacteria bacterium CG10_big_fil_rev_8_21_14_0_10_36_24]|uniref:DNA recombination protein RmuC n=2 Tax=Candidatus Nealsoniibacteriota TaxID=1817911 RepID=A0A2H0YPE1_9BACT|nr:MAG: DNA recombination protein RmuC [Candidatus Nealsonbacteria bacterium CG10_big_fil_rev_8_21_14_0_10_36_24]PIS40338.1 MAG: DNA recombination protein RmuC [Candidatus Nealsonbacteria bacterium CG08_land_8_20_14_0_20_36_22]